MSSYSWRKRKNAHNSNRLDNSRKIFENIPPSRPVLIIEDGRHSSHIFMEVIKLAQDNDVHLLCLPSHTTHILQTLDTSPFKTFL